MNNTIDTTDSKKRKVVISRTIHDNEKYVLPPCFTPNKKEMEKNTTVDLNTIHSVCFFTVKCEHVWVSY